jgi:hypothetical protein
VWSSRWPAGADASSAAIHGKVISYQPWHGWLLVWSSPYSPPAADLPERRRVAGRMVSVAASRVVRVAAQRAAKVAAQRVAELAALRAAEAAAS